MQELEKILKEIDKATDEYGMVDYINDEPVISKNRAKDIIRKHLSHENTPEITRSSQDNDGWIPVEERLPEEEVSVLAQWEKYDKYLNVKLIYLDVMWLDDAEKKVFETINGVPNGKVTAWRPLPEPYRPERSNDEKE